MSEKIICSICGTRIAEGDYNYFDGQVLCDDCLEQHTTVCDCCSNRIWNDHAEGDAYVTLCYRCYENHYTTCEDCGRLIHYDDANYDDDNDLPYCNQCYAKLSNRSIHAYNYKPEPIFYGSGDLFMGVELEIDGGGEIQDNAKSLLNIANVNGDRIYCKHDGSLNEGFEIVSHPMTLEYHLHEMNWSSLMEEALEMDYLSHNTSSCGLHIHVNEYEAGAVKLIFEMYLAEHSYTEIIDELNRRGYKTRRELPFAKNSIYDLLHNERYTGVYIYVKDTSKNSKGKYARHGAEYNSDDIIRIPGGMPQIISEEDFRKVQEKMSARQHKAAKFSAKQDYLLSGKIFCGECGSSFAGNSRRPDAKHPMYVSYKCTRHNQRDEKCRNPEINREKVEGAVIKKLSSVIFNPNVIPALVREYNDYIAQKSGSAKSTLESLKKELASVDNKISKTVDLMIETGSAAMKAKLAELEASKEKLTFEISRLEVELGREQYTEEKVRGLFVAAEKQLRNGTLANRRAVIEQYVDKVVVYPEKIEIYLKIMGDFEMKEVVAVK